MFIFELFIAVYLLWRGIMPLGLKYYWKLLIALIILPAAFKFHLLFLIGGGNYFSPELPKWLLLGGAWAFSGVFILFFLLLLLDIVRLIMFCLRHIKKSSQPKFSPGQTNCIHAIIFLTALLLCSIGIYYGTSLPEVKSINISSNQTDWPSQPLKIVLLADIHADNTNRAERISEIVRRTNALQADLILLAGDFVDGPVAKHGVDLEPLSNLKAQYGVFGVPGNHEYYSGYSEWMNFFDTIGVKILQNSNHLLSELKLAIIGVTDPNAKRFHQSEPNFVQATNSIPSDYYKIAVVHQPKLAQEAADAGVDLQLSGHTHGGSIILFDKIVARYNCGYVSGLYQVDKMQLYVSNGSGIWGGFPIRLGVPSEITLITLSSN
ncbi:MAG: metallophosphoesterase, partial [Victivallaceae bacterium]